MNKHLFEGYPTADEITLERFEEAQRERDFFAGKVERMLDCLQLVAIDLRGQEHLQDMVLRIMYEADEGRANAFFDEHKGAL